MTSVLDILFGVTGQSITYDCPEGRPSSVTSVDVYAATAGDDGTTESATTGSASVETNPNTTLDAAAGQGQADPTLLPVAATTGFAIGQRYLVTSATNGRSEFFECGAVISAVSVNAREELVNTYASSDTVQSTRISISVDSTWVADGSNISDNLDPNPGYRVRIVYVVGGVTHIAQVGMNLVRYKARHTVQPTDMVDLVPQWIDRLPSKHRKDQGRRLLDEAFEQCRWDLFTSGIAGEMIRHQGAIDELVKHKAVVMLEADRGADAYMLERAETHYQKRLDGMFRVSATVAQATDTSGGGRIATPRGIMQK